MKWTAKDIRILKKYYPLYGSTGPKGCIKRLSRLGVIRSRKSVSLKAWSIGLSYSGAKKGVYLKGRTPENKGKKMSAKAYAKCSKTFFKSGRLPHNTRYEGAMTYRKGNTGRWYWYVRISKANWDLLHRIIYKNVYNITLKTKEVVRFIDGDTNNIHPDNLHLMTNGENLDLNNPHMHYPPDVVTAIKLNNKIKKILKSNAKKQNK